MFEKIPTHELELIKEKLDEEHFHITKEFVERELAQRAVKEAAKKDQGIMVEAILNDISAIYNDMESDTKNNNIDL